MFDVKIPKHLYRLQIVQVLVEAADDENVKGNCYAGMVVSCNIERG